MSPSTAPRDAHGLARYILRVLLDPSSVDYPPSGRLWPTLAQVAWRNGVLVRTIDRLSGLGSAPPVDVAATVAYERSRSAGAVGLVGILSDTCTRLGIEHAFMDALDHYPDCGTDIDLLLGECAPQQDEQILRGLSSATPIRQDLASRIAGATRYAALGFELDIRHGRLGALGEDLGYARLVIERRSRITVPPGVALYQPAAADRMILQGLKRVYARRRIRLANVLLTVASLRDDQLPWDEIIERSRGLGILAGLSCYLSYVEEIHVAALGRPLLPDIARRALRRQHWGRLAFGETGYRFPTMRVNSRLYLEKLGANVGRRSWDGAGRLCLLPIVAAMSLLTPRGRSSTLSTL
jgi:hypothetical protein